MTSFRFFLVLLCCTPLLHATLSARMTSLVAGSVGDTTIAIGARSIGDSIAVNIAIRNAFPSELSIDSIVCADTRYYSSIRLSVSRPFPFSILPASSLEVPCTLVIRHNVALDVVIYVHGHAGCSSFVQRMRVTGSASARGYEYTDNAEGVPLLDTLRSRVVNHTSLGYKAAREVMFGKADNVNDSVECVYTGKKLKTAGIPPNGEFNTEHSWPQSVGSSSEPNKSDIYHLYPTNPNANSMRANFPFGVIAKVWKDAGGGSRLGFTAKGDTVFEPRDVVKGNIARGIFYYYLRYGNLFNYYRSPYAMDADLRAWNAADPPDSREKARCDTIAAYQGKRNPFVDHPQFIERMDLMPATRSTTRLLPSVQTVVDTASTWTTMLDVFNLGSGDMRVTRIIADPPGGVRTVVNDSTVRAHGLSSVRLEFTRSAMTSNSINVRVEMSDSSNHEATVQVCGATDVGNVVALQAQVRPQPFRESALVKVSDTRESIEWVQIVDERGASVQTMRWEPEWNDAGTYVRVVRNEGVANGMVMLRAKVAKRIVSTMLVLE